MVFSLRHGNSNHGAHNNNHDVEEVSEVILYRIEFDKLDLLVNDKDGDEVRTKANACSEYSKKR